MKYLFLTAFLLTGMGMVCAQNNDSLVIRKIADEILTNGQAYNNLRILCKQIGPRLSGSAQAARAVDFTFRKMKEMGADTVFLQECMVPHWVRGKKEEARILYPNGTNRSLKVCALGNSVGTPEKGLTASVIEVRSFAELEELGAEKIRGHIVFFNYRMNPLFVNTFRAYGDAYQYRGSGPAIAAKFGAIGVMIRSLASNDDDHPHTGTTEYVDSIRKIPAIALSTNDADILSRELKKRIAIRVFFKTNCRMLADVKSYNVVGELKGTEFPNEIVTVGGHLDSWDLAEGAHDDGAGCVQSMEIISTFKALAIQPRRTIRVVMFMNEENGSRGGDKYAEIARTAEDKKFIFALESDAGGFTPRGFGFTASTSQKARIWEWKKLFEPYGICEFYDGGDGADIEPLGKMGTALAGLVPDSQRYFDVHHAETDVLEAVSVRELKLGAINMAALIYLASEYGMN